ncbi:MAG: VanZ family protein [Candidatus Sumerlaeota bacterium]|nr:VanZ family protein [Candidatus Sumerlaeota bacterium]
MSFAKFRRRFAQRHPGWYFVAPAVLCAAAIFWASGLTGSQIPDLGFSIPFADKYEHIIAYSVFAALLARALAKGGPLTRRMAMVCVVVAALYGVTDEFHQIFVPGRFCSAVDWTADVVGSAVGIIAYWATSRRSARVPAAEFGESQPLPPK